MTLEARIRVVEKDSFFEEGERIYKKLKARLEKKHKGKIIAVEAESGEYVIGEDEVRVAKEACERFPGKIFTFFRIGYPVVHKVRANR